MLKSSSSVSVSVPVRSLRFYCPVSCADLPYLSALTTTFEEVIDRAGESVPLSSHTSFMRLSVFSRIRYRLWLPFCAPWGYALNSLGPGRACPATALPGSHCSSSRFVDSLRPRRVRPSRLIRLDLFLSRASCVFRRSSRVSGSLSHYAYLVGLRPRRFTKDTSAGPPMWAAYALQQCVSCISSLHFTPHCTISLGSFNIMLIRCLAVDRFGL